MQNKKPRFNDRIIREGFPDGWFIQDRICQNEALLCRKSDFSTGGLTCICTRPRAMDTDDWVLHAQIIAFGFEAENNRRIAQHQSS
ncbi:hypothetical protein [Roseobacter sp. SK209-2-6]|uniref:hypothetical protein n=1 Tax=Roseobacter sp. SK209-2-6 TaxID=388739 RepID=UPI000559BDD6|nr:hypothetical protein [Roseobacter sp. SK209-2-6]